MGITMAEGFLNEPGGLCWIRGLSSWMGSRNPTSEDSRLLSFRVIMSESTIQGIDDPLLPPRSKQTP